MIYVIFIHVSIDLKGLIVFSSHIWLVCLGNYISYYSLLPGHSLVKDAIKVIQVDHPEECAKECISVDDFDCQSFDFCSQVLLGTKKRR